MKKVFIISVMAIILLLIFTSALYSYEVSKVLLKNGTVVKGKVIEKKPDGSIVFETIDGFTLTIDSEDIYQIVSVQFPKTGSVGIGLGVPYGILGFNIDFTVANNLNLSGGIGTTIFAGVGYSIGAKYFFRDVGHTWRPRVLIFYGINSMIYTEIYTEDYSGEVDESWKYSGLTLGIGQQWTFGESKRHSFDLDLMYLATQGDFHDKKEKLEDEGYDITGGDAKIKISLGYRYCF